MKKKMLIYCILFACLILFLFRAWNCIRKNRLKITEGGESNAMVKIFRSSYRFSGNVYVVYSEKGTILIDIGYYDLGIKKYLMEIGDLDIGTYHIQVIHTPGHTKGSVMYYFTAENLLFTGDTILEDVTGPTYRPTGSNQDMKDSVKRFKTLDLC